MKKFLFFLCCGILIFYFWDGIDTSYEKSSQLRHTLSKVTDNLKKRYKLNYSGLMESSKEDAYIKVGLIFNVNEILTKDKGREILLESIQEMLDAINSDKNLR